MTYPNMRVLAVDDDPHVLKLLQLALDAAGFPNDVASDGDLAIEMLRLHPYAIVILDLRMPKVDGFGVMERIRELSNRPLVVVITGHRGEQGERLPADVVHAVLDKPFDAMWLVELMHECARQLIEARRFAN